MNYDEAAYSQKDFIHDLLAPFPKPIVTKVKTETPAESNPEGTAA